jgi:hypothetical protein
VTISIGVRNLIGAIVTPTTVRAFSVTPSAVNLGATSSRTGADETGGQLRFALSALGTAGTDLDAESEMPIATFSSALSSAELSLIYSYYNGSAAYGLVQLDGSGYVTLGGVTLGSSGLEELRATLTTTLQDLGLGSTGSEGIAGQFAAAIDSAYLLSFGSETIEGSTSSTLSGISSTLVGSETIEGLLSVAIDAPSLEASSYYLTGSVGQIDSTLGDAFSEFLGAQSLEGSIDSTLGDAFSEFLGAQSLEGSIDSTLGDAFSEILAESVVSGQLYAVFQAVEEVSFLGGETLSGSVAAAVGFVSASAHTRIAVKYIPVYRDPLLNFTVVESSQEYDNVLGESRTVVESSQEYDNVLGESRTVVESSEIYAEPFDLPPAPPAYVPIE